MELKTIFIKNKTKYFTRKSWHCKTESEKLLFTKFKVLFTFTIL